MGVEQLSKVHYDILKEINLVLDRLGADVGYFAALNSWGDTLPETEVLLQLKQMNRQDTDETSCRT